MLYTNKNYLNDIILAKKYLEITKLKKYWYKFKKLEIKKIWKLERNAKLAKII